MTKASASHKIGWLPLLCLMAAGLILVAALILWLWQVGVKNRLMAQVAAYRAAGEPIWVTDFAAPAVPDAQNAAIDLAAAADSIDEKSDAWTQYDKLNLGLPLIEQEQQAIAAVIKEDKAGLDRAHQATTKPAVDWGLGFKSPIVLVRMDFLNKQRKLARALAADAVLAHQNGRDAAAMQRVEDVLFVSRAMEGQHTIVTHLVSVGVSALGIYWLEQIAPDLRIGPGAGAASPEQVRRIIAALLDDRPARQGLRDAFLGERAMCLDSVLSMSNGTLSGTGSPMPFMKPGLAGLFRPLLLADARIMIVYDTQVMEAAGKSADMGALRRNLPPRPAEISASPNLHVLANIMLPAMERFVETDFRGMTDRRLAATALAIRWYATEHDGKLPGTLEELVPTYLPAVPSDPMADGKLVRYLPNGARPIIYSVGADGVDQGGSTKPLRGFQGGSWGTLDEVIDLKRQPRPATQESDN